jgi:hypothetical protein
MSESAASAEPHTIASDDALDDTDDVVAAPRAYMYQVHVRRRHGVWKRWQGRVVTRDLQGTRRFWPWRLSHDRDRLVQQLWEETMRDIQWRNSETPVEIVEVS